MTGGRRLCWWEVLSPESSSCSPSSLYFRFIPVSPRAPPHPSKQNRDAESSEPRASVITMGNHIPTHAKCIKVWRTPSTIPQHIALPTLSP